ncbi:MAG: DUF962 domain-containing protein [Polyangiales bacterium]
MSDKPEMKTFEEFWPYYVKAHSHKSNRRLHFAGTSAAMGLVAASVITRRWWLAALAPVVGYGCAWVGHFLVEGNVPATFGHPLWSFQADFIMWKKTLEGSMDAEVERVLAADPKSAVVSSESPADGATPSTAN